MHPLLTIFIICTLIGIPIAYCICKHFARAKEFNPRWFDDMELWESERRNIRPVIEPTTIPKSHYRSYNRNWFVVLLILICVVILCSCGRDLHNGKSYIVEEVKGTGYVLKLKGIDELFTVPVNTHKVGDTIKVFRTFKESKATIY